MADWTERDVEDWVCGNPRELWLVPGSHVEVVGRQITLPDGRRLDVLLLVRDPDHGLRLVVVEVKVGQTDAAAVVQLLRYVEEMQKHLPTSVRICGLLLGADHPNDVVHLVRAMPSVGLATYHTYIECYGVWGDGDGDPGLGWRVGRNGSGSGINPAIELILAARDRLDARRPLPAPLELCPAVFAHPNGRRR